MNLIFLALPILAANPFLQAFQDTDANELRFHRVHLTNGNFIDGQLVKDSPSLVLLQVRSGEMGIRRDQIDRVEFIKMRDRRLPPAVTEKPKTDPRLTPTDVKPVDVKAPAEIKKRVDFMIWKLKTTTGTDKEFNTGELASLGDEAIVYLASKAPEFDLKMMDVLMAALVTLKNRQVVPIMEGFMSHANPTVRAMAVTVLGVTVTAPEKPKYLRPALTDPDPRVRETVLGILGATDDRDWFAPVSDLCGDENKEVRSKANRIARSLAAKYEMNEAFSRTMVGLLTSNNEGIRADSAAMLGVLGIKDNWTHVASALTDPADAVRASAAQALMNIAAPESGDAILTALFRERERWTRGYLAGAAQKIKLMKAIEPIIPWVSDPDEDVKRVAITVLSSLTGENLGADREKWTAWWERNRPK